MAVSAKVSEVKGGKNENILTEKDKGIVLDLVEGEIGSVGEERQAGGHQHHLADGRNWKWREGGYGSDSSRRNTDD